jgi:hypothetical protein
MADRPGGVRSGADIVATAPCCASGPPSPSDPRSTRGCSVHSYQPQWPEDRSNWTVPNPTDFTYRDARDIAAYAANDALTTWYTYPHIWHLDREGRWRCCSKGSSLDSVRRFAEAPAHLLKCRQVPTQHPCPDYWVVLEPRHRWDLDGQEVTEGDVEAFLVLRNGLARHGVRLLDVVILNEEFHWWSLHELTSGTTTWSF